MSSVTESICRSRDWRKRIFTAETRRRRETQLQAFVSATSASGARQAFIYRASNTNSESAEEAEIAELPEFGFSATRRTPISKLLDETLPVAIHTEVEYRRLLAAAGVLMEKPEDEISEEEGRLLELLSILIEEYENRAHPLPNAKPHRMLAYLLKERDMKPSDLWTVLPKSRVSEILNGKRSISKTQAKQLAELFHVPVELFL